MNSLPMSGATALIARLRRPLFLPLLAFALLMAVMPEALAHGVPEGDKGFIQESTGVMLMPFPTTPWAWLKNVQLSKSR